MGVEISCRRGELNAWKDFFRPSLSHVLTSSGELSSQAQQVVWKWPRRQWPSFGRLEYHKAQPLFSSPPLLLLESNAISALVHFL